MKDLIFDCGVKIKDPDSNSFIYCWENAINHKKYVGQTKTGKKRLADEKSICNVYGAFKNALIKYGQINFKCDILEYCDENVLDLKEQYWIQQEQSHFSQHGYNLTWGGQEVSSLVYLSTLTNRYFYQLEEIPEEEFDSIFFIWWES